MTFRQFLRSHRDEQTAIGDLARDALIDPEWKGQRSADSLRTVLNAAGASQAAHETLDGAEAAYNAMRERRR